MVKERVIESEALIQLFVAKHPEFDHISITEMKKVIRSEFKVMKVTMEEGKLQDFRLQYMFVLKGMPSKVLRQLHKTYHPNNLYEYFKHYAPMLLNAVRLNPKKFFKYQQRVSEITGVPIEDIHKGDFSKSKRKI